MASVRHQRVLLHQPPRLVTPVAPAQLLANSFFFSILDRKEGQQLLTLLQRDAPHTAACAQLESDCSAG
jgi:hypothetical protein